MGWEHPEGGGESPGSQVTLGYRKWRRHFTDVHRSAWGALGCWSSDPNSLCHLRAACTFHRNPTELSESKRVKMLSPWLLVAWAWGPQFHLQKTRANLKMPPLLHHSLAGDG